MSTTNENFFQKVWEGIESIFHKAEDKAKIIAHAADTITNAIKNFEGAPTMQTIEATIESIFPVTIPLVNAFHLWFPKVAATVANVVTETEKTPEEQYHDLIEYLESAKVIDPTVYAGILNTINGTITKWIADNQGVIVTTEQALAAPQVVHANS